MKHPVLTLLSAKRSMVIKKIKTADQTNFQEGTEQIESVLGQARF